MMVRNDPTAAIVRLRWIVSASIATRLDPAGSHERNFRICMPCRCSA
jgi:hypothetical protein